MKKNKTLFTFIIGFAILIKIVALFNNPVLGGDGPWAMSQVFSYVNGFTDRSVFAHDFLGKIFTVHFVDFLQSRWFKVFEISTYSFIGYQFLIIICSFSLWLYIIKNHFKESILIYFLMFGYFISPYLYGFRPENFVILVQLCFLAVLFSTIRNSVKLVVISFLCVLTGLIHHVGGLITVVISIYYFVFVLKDYKTFSLFTVLCILISALVTRGEIINYLLLATKYKSEVGNHLTGIDFKHFFKYLIYAGPIPIIILFIFRKIFSKSDWVFVMIFIIILSILGRSYYIVYIYVSLLFLLILRNKLNVIRFSKIDKPLVYLGIAYSFLFLFTAPLVLNLMSSAPNSNWRKLISQIKNEKISWNASTKYYVPSQLSLEVVDQSNARLIYPFMLHNDGIQDVKSKVFYIYKKEQLRWIKKNFNTSNKTIDIQELIPETEGHYMISSLYKLKKIRSTPFGLWKISYN